MPQGRRRRGQGRHLSQRVYVAFSGTEVEVFADAADAECFAGENPGTRIRERPVRRSVDDAVVIFDRRVVVTQGAAVADHTQVVRRFIDDPLDQPGPADVEWFHDAGDSEWHIAGFGVDQRALEDEIQSAINELRRRSSGLTVNLLRDRTA